MRNRLKNQNGIISVFAMLAMLFFLLFIMGAYITISAKNRSQKESNMELLKLYSTKVDSQQIYNDMVADSNEVIPIYSYDQLERVGSNYVIAIKGRLYYFNRNRQYSVKSNLSLPTDGTYDNVYKGEVEYCNKNSLYLHLDGENNSGKGHSNTILEWHNLSTLGPRTCEFYAGGIKKNNSRNILKNGVSLDGSGDYVLAKDVLSGLTNEHTMEMVFKANSIYDEYILGNKISSLAIKNIPNVGPTLVGDFSLGDEKRSGDIYANSSDGLIESDKIYHVALTYDGKNLIIYKNGKKIATSSTIFTDYRTFKTLKLTEKTTSYKNYYIGFHTYIGKEGDEESKNGITIKPYFDNTKENVLSSAEFNESKSSVEDVSSSFNETITYYKPISDLNYRRSVSFNLYIDYITPEGPGNQEYEISNDVGTNVNEDPANYSFTQFAIGTDSLILKSNIGKIQTWYFNDEEKSPTKETKIFGSYYYSFDDLQPDTEYNIKAVYSSSEIKNNNLTADNIYIGRSYEHGSQTLGGIVYSVRVYNSVLTEDNIKTNFNIDKAKFGIHE